MMALCLSAGALSATLLTQNFTLAWMHSVEKIRWEEDWNIEQMQLHLISARVKGTGAGMEPPPDAVFKNGAWHYHPHIQPLQSIILSHSPYTKEYELCIDFTCKPLSTYLPQLETTATITLEACER